MSIKWDVFGEVREILIEMGKGKGHWGHKGRKGKRGGSLPSSAQGQIRAEEKLPKMPRLKTSGTIGEVNERAIERKQAMEQEYGVDFSTYVSNPLGIKQAKEKGMWWSDLPQAIYRHKTTKPLNDARLERIFDETHQKWKAASGYVTFNTLKFGSGLSFDEVFGIARAKYDRDPYSVRFTVNRMNDPTMIKVVR